MSTGYTAKIKDGIDFKTFTMDCARAVGPCITLRDKSGGGEIIPQKFEPSDYHLRQIESARVELKRIETLDRLGCQREADAEWRNGEESRIRTISEMRDLRLKYETVLLQIYAWEPPTKDHVELKKFMLDQVQESIKFDCDVKFCSNPEEKKTPEQWCDDKINKLKAKIKYHKEEHAKEIKLAEGRTRWVQELRNSLSI